MLFQFHLYTHCIFTLLLIVEGISFLLISVLVSHSLYKMGKYTILTNKATQVLAAGVFIMCLFMYCAVLSVFSLIRAFDMLESYDDDDGDTEDTIRFLSDFVDAMYGQWTMYTMYVVLGELFPLTVLIYIQASHQPREKPSNYMDLNLGEGESTEVTSVLSSTYHPTAYENIHSPHHSEL
uniref:Uncharacterized protein n=1 Tax=Paramoeba aestuarina TaxID=180227 RepID=A0A7S4K7D3_9EUKA